MSDTAEATFAAAGRASRLWRDAAEMLVLRRQLAEAEIRSDIAAGKRLGIATLVGAVVALTGLPVIVAALGSALDRWLSGGQPAFPWATLSLGALFLASGLAMLWAGWRRFRRDFNGLQSSLAEIQEDFVWLREWVDGDAGEG